MSEEERNERLQVEEVGEQEIVTLEARPRDFITIADPAWLEPTITFRRIDGVIAEPVGVVSDSVIIDELTERPTEETEEGYVSDTPLAKFKENILENRVELTIVSQARDDFEYYFFFNSEGEYLGRERTSNRDIKYEINSATCVEFRDDDVNHEYIYLFLKGHNDFRKKDVKVDIPLNHYKQIRKCLEELECVFITDEEKEPVKEYPERITKYQFEGAPSDDELEKMISLVDLDVFNNIIRARLIQEDNIDAVKKVNKTWAKKYLKHWAISKYRFYKIFGDKLTLETDVKIDLNEIECGGIIEELKGKFPLYRRILNEITRSAVFENNIGSKNDSNIGQVFYEDPRVKDNMSFTKFISLYGNKELDTEVSKIYQDRGKSHLTISINPIDYLTVSINKSSWKSCHNFYDGCYRNAGLSYMLDETSLVSYRSNNKVDYVINGKKFQWNSKNWRQMIYVSEYNSTMVFSRQYPNENENIAKEIRHLLEEKIAEYFGGSNKWKVTNHIGNFDGGVERVDDCYLLYNDVDEGYNHKAVKAKDDIDFDGNSDIEIGSEVPCLFEDDQIKGGEDHLC